MSTIPITVRDPELEWNLPARGQVAMFALIVAESAIFVIFVVAYLFYIGKSLSGPAPKDVLEPPILYTICLLTSSITVHLAVRALRSGNLERFKAWWLATIVLGDAFIYGTADDWHRLIYEDRLTITTNLFGTTFYSLVGLHAFHVIIGLTLLSTVMAFAILGHIQQQHTYRVAVLSIYWHFVDAVWIVVFTVVYIVGR